MATEMRPTTNFSMTRFSGGRDRGVCVQVTQRNTQDSRDDVGFVQMTRQDAAEMAVALMEFAMGTRAEED